MLPRLSLEELKNQAWQALALRLPEINTLDRRSLWEVLVTVWVGMLQSVYDFSDSLLKQCFVLTATGHYLDLHGSVFGVIRSLSSPATASVTFRSPTNGLNVPIGLRVISPTGQVFITTTSVDVVSNIAVVAVQSVEGGTISNGASGTFSLLDALAGFESTAEGTAQVGGLDNETDDAYRLKILQRLQNPPNGGSLSDYERWSYEVAGITRAKAFDLAYGANTVAIRFMRDDGVGTGIPTSPQVAELYNYLTDPIRKPAGAFLYVQAPTAVPLNPTIALNPNTTPIQNAVIAELKRLLINEGGFGATLRRSKISEAISIAVGENYHSLTLPASDVSIANDQVLTLGTPTFTTL